MELKIVNKSYTKDGVKRNYVAFVAVIDDHEFEVIPKWKTDIKLMLYLAEKQVANK